MRIESWMWLAALALSAGCSLMTDTTKKQCEKDDECERLFGTDTLYQCVSNYCTRPSCSKSEDCQALGITNGLCDEDKRCKAGCIKNSDCGDNMTCSAGACEARECEKASDCPGSSTSKACNSGKCEDMVWGCIGAEDTRPAATEPTATLKTTIVNANPRVPIPGLVITVCRLAAYDPKCTKPLEGVTSKYDETNGNAVISGLPQDTPFRLKLDPPSDSGLLPLDFYMQRPVRDETEERQIVVLSESLVRTLANAFSPPATVDPDEAALYLTTFDCQDRPAMGVKIEVDKNDVTPGTQIGYLSEGGLVSAALTSTSSTGQGNVLNLPADKLVALSTKLNGDTVSNYSVMPLAGRNTTVRFYPRKYE